MGVLLPEIQLKKILDYYLNIVNQDFQDSVSAGNEQASLLYQMFGGIVLDNYNFYDQAKAIILKGDDNPRHLEVRIFFDRTRASIPTIHLNLPSENPDSDSIGYGLGNNDPEFSSDNSTFKEILQRDFNTVFNITVTSDNTFEVIIIYTLLKAIMVSGVEIMELNGLRNPKISGKDLMAHMDSPQPLFLRVLTLSFLYEFSVPEIKSQTVYNSFKFQGSTDDILFGEVEI